MPIENLTADADVFTANVYFVPGEVPTLVDAGAMTGIEEQITDIDSIVVTHQHGDHVQELEAVVERFSPQVFAYDDHPLRTDPIDDGDTVTIGDDEFEVVFTPGHADDHVAFLSETTIFSGDVVVYNDGAFDDGSFGRTDLAGQSRETLIESIERLLDRLGSDVDSLYAGHGDPFHGDVRSVIERALKRAERREPKYPE